MADVIYNSYKKILGDGAIDWLTDTIKVMLVTSAYTPDQDAHDFKDDITNEISGTGYTAGGAALASKTNTQDDTDDEGVQDAADTVWSGATFTTRGAVIYKDTGTPSTSPIIAYIDFGEDKSPSGADFTIEWNAEGIININ